MGVGAGLYIYNVVVKKVHIRYLISWWVLLVSITVWRHASACRRHVSVYLFVTSWCSTETAKLRTTQTPHDNPGTSRD